METNGPATRCDIIIILLKLLQIYEIKQSSKMMKKIQIGVLEYGLRWNHSGHEKQSLLSLPAVFIINPRRLERSQAEPNAKFDGTESHFNN